MSYGFRVRYAINENGQNFHTPFLETREFPANVTVDSERLPSGVSAQRMYRDDA